MLRSLLALPRTVLAKPTPQNDPAPTTPTPPPDYLAQRSKALGILIDLGTAGLAMYRDRTVPDAYKGIGRVAFSLIAGGLGMGSVLNATDNKDLSPWWAVAAGGATAGLMYATRGLNTRANNLWDRMLTGVGIPNPQIVSGLVTFAVLRYQAAVDEAAATRHRLPTPKPITVEPTHANLPQPLKDLLHTIANAANPIPGATQALHTQIDQVSVELFDQTLDEVLNSDEAFLTLRPGPTQDTHNSQNTTTLIHPLEHTYPVYARLTQDGHEHRLRLHIEDRQLSALSAEPHTAPLPFAQWIDASEIAEVVSEFA